MKQYRFELTCSGCPEQYDIWDDELNIKVAYVRYRWGYLRVCPYFPEQFEVTNEWTKKTSIEQKIDWDTTIYDDNIGDSLDGILPDNKREQILAVINYKIYKYWNDGEYYDKDGYKPYVNLVNSGEIEDVTEKWKHKLNIN